MARLIFEHPTEEQLKHIHKAEEELSKAGVTFDTGSDIDSGKITSRDWELDWSLEGAIIKEENK